MDFELGKGVTVTVNPSELPEEQLLQGAAEFNAALEARGLLHPAGALAVEGATETSSDATTEAKLDPIDPKEAITNQLSTSFSGYLATVVGINKGCLHKIEAASHETLTTEFSEWFDDARQAYVAEAMEVGNEFYLLAVPNETVTVGEILANARDFGKDQPYQTTIQP